MNSKVVYQGFDRVINLPGGMYVVRVGHEVRKAVVMQP